MTTQNDVHDGARAALGLAVATLDPEAVDPSTVVAVIDAIDVDALVAGAALLVAWLAREVADRDEVSTAAVLRAVGLHLAEPTS